MFSSIVQNQDFHLEFACVLLFPPLCVPRVKSIHCIPMVQNGARCRVEFWLCSHVNLKPYLISFTMVYCYYNCCPGPSLALLCDFLLPISPQYAYTVKVGGDTYFHVENFSIIWNPSWCPWPDFLEHFPHIFLTYSPPCPQICSVTQIIIF